MRVSLKIIFWLPYHENITSPAVRSYGFQVFLYAVMTFYDQRENERDAEWDRLCEKVPGTQSIYPQRMMPFSSVCNSPYATETTDITIMPHKLLKLF